MTRAGECDRTPCPAADLGDVVEVELDGFRSERLGRDRVQGPVIAISPYLHALQVGSVFVGGHLSTDVVRVTPRERS